MKVFQLSLTEMELTLIYRALDTGGFKGIETHRTLVALAEKIEKVVGMRPTPPASEDSPPKPNGTETKATETS